MEMLKRTLYPAKSVQGEVKGMKKQAASAEGDNGNRKMTPGAREAIPFDKFEEGTVNDF
jgi:hypothetical protein